jgi:hypothetical protein
MVMQSRFARTNIRQNQHAPAGPSRAKFFDWTDYQPLRYSRFR